MRAAAITVVAAASLVMSACGGGKHDPTTGSTSAASLQGAMPRVPARLCRQAFTTGLRRTPPRFRANFAAISVRTYASRLCRYIVSEQQVNGDGSIKPGAVGVVLARHPRFGVPLLYATLMVPYSPKTSALSRKAYSKFARRLALLELQHGVFHTTGLTPNYTTTLTPQDYHLRAPAAGELTRRVMAELRTSGDIH